MEYIRLGKTNHLVSRVAFGAMNLDKIGDDESVATLIRTAYETGINFFDTSRKTPASEKLLGDSLFDYRKNVFLSTSTSSKTASEIEEDLEESLMALHTDYLDLYQLEIEKFLPVPLGADKIYQTLMKFKSQGKIKNIGILTTNYETAKKVAELNLYDCIQFPLNVLNYDSIKDLVPLCEKQDLGFIAMQPLCGGVVENIPLAMGFMNQFESVVPLWGMKSIDELNQILYFNEHKPEIDEKFQADVEHLRNFFN